jgi:hypothetical protein
MPTLLLAHCAVDAARETSSGLGMIEISMPLGHIFVPAKWYAKVPTKIARLMSYCAIDFGTSNSSVVVANTQSGTRLVPLEDEQHTMPTAVFFFTDEHEAAQANGVHRPEGALSRAYVQPLWRPTSTGMRAG